MSVHKATNDNSFSFLVDSNSFSQVDHSDSTDYPVHTSISKHSGSEGPVEGSSNLCYEYHSGGQDYSNATDSKSFGLYNGHIITL